MPLFQGTCCCTKNLQKADTEELAMKLKRPGMK